MWAGSALAMLERELDRRDWSEMLTAESFLVGCWNSVKGDENGAIDIVGWDGMGGAKGPRNNKPAAPPGISSLRYKRPSQV